MADTKTKNHTWEDLEATLRAQAKLTFDYSPLEQFLSIIEEFKKRTLTTSEQDEWQALLNHVASQANPSEAAPRLRVFLQAAQRAANLRRATAA